MFRQGKVMADGFYEAQPDQGQQQQDRYQNVDSIDFVGGNAAPQAQSSTDTELPVAPVSSQKEYKDGQKFLVAWRVCMTVLVVFTFANTLHSIAEGDCGCSMNSNANGFASMTTPKHMPATTQGSTTTSVPIATQGDNQKILPNDTIAKLSDNIRKNTVLIAALNATLSDMGQVAPPLKATNSTSSPLRPKSITSTATATTIFNALASGSTSITTTTSSSSSSTSTTSSTLTFTTTSATSTTSTPSTVSTLTSSTMTLHANLQFRLQDVERELQEAKEELKETETSLLHVRDELTDVKTRLSVVESETNKQKSTGLTSKDSGWISFGTNNPVQKTYVYNHGGGEPKNIQLYIKADGRQWIPQDWDDNAYWRTGVTIELKSGQILLNVRGGLYHHFYNDRGFKENHANMKETMYYKLIIIW